MDGGLLSFQVGNAEGCIDRPTWFKITPVQRHGIDKALTKIVLQIFLDSFQYVVPATLGANPAQGNMRTKRVALGRKAAGVHHRSDVPTAPAGGGVKETHRAPACGLGTAIGVSRLLVMRSGWAQLDPARYCQEIET